MAKPHWYGVTIDCPDAKALAEFYRDLSDLPYTEHEGGFYSLGSEDRAMILLQPVENYTPPTWPSQERGQQMHLDFQVEDLDAAVADAEKLGATLADEQPGQTWRVMLDPAGHPFCLAKIS